MSTKYILFDSTTGKMLSHSNDNIAGYELVDISTWDPSTQYIKKNIASGIVEFLPFETKPTVEDFSTTVDQTEILNNTTLVFDRATLQWTVDTIENKKMKVSTGIAISNSSGIFQLDITNLNYSKIYNIQATCIRSLINGNNNLLDNINSRPFANINAITSNIIQGIVLSGKSILLGGDSTTEPADLSDDGNSNPVYVHMVVYYS